MGANAVPEPRTINFEDVFDHVGHFGPFQILSYALISVIAIGHGYQAMSMVFLAYEQPAWCTVGRLENFTYDQQRHIAIPWDKRTDSYDKCNVFDLPWDNYTDETLMTWDRANMTSSANVIKCREHTYDRSVFATTIQTEWDLVCGSSWWIQMASSAYMAGMLVGSILSGILADKFGRLRPLVLFSSLHPVLGIASAYSPNVLLYCFLRFALSVCAFGAFLGGFVLVTELVGPRARSAASISYNMIFAFGALLLTGYGYAVRDVVWLQLLMALPVLWTLAYYGVLCESPRWLVSQGRQEDAWKILFKMAEVNGQDPPENLCFQEQPIQSTPVQKVAFVELFKYPYLRRSLLIVCLIWFTDSLLFYGLGLNVGDLLGDVFINHFLMSLADVPGNIIGSLCCGRVGRRLTLMVSLLVAGVANLLCIPLQVTRELPWLVTAFSLIGKSAAGLGFAVAFLITAELFPTQARQVAMGTASVSARVAGMASPYVGGPLRLVWVALPSTLFGTMGVVAGLATFFLPETLNSPMPDSMEDAERQAASRWKRDEPLVNSSFVESQTSLPQTPVAYRKDLDPLEDQTVLGSL